jgi:hypothetical protein
MSSLPVATRTLLVDPSGTLDEALTNWTSHLPAPSDACRVIPR